MATLEIAPEKVAFVILKAREFDAKVEPFDDGDTETSDEQPDADGVLENRSEDSSLLELQEFIDALNEDEALDLVALTWVGRGTFGVDEWDEARRTARDEAGTSTSRYLLGIPTLADFLEEGLAAFDIDPADVENDVAGEG